MNRTNICKNIVQSIKDYITDQVKLEPHRMEKHFVRRRKLSLLQVIIYLFFSSKASMFQNLSQIREELGTLSFPDVSKQALSKARQFINPSLFKELYYLSVDLFYSQISSRKLWQGYHLFAVDGSRIELPNSKSTFDFFGEMSSYPDPNRRYTMGLASIIYDVLDDYIQSKIPVTDIFCIQSHYFFEVCDVTSSTYLPHTCNPRFDGNSGSVMQFIFLQFIL